MTTIYNKSAREALAALKAVAAKPPPPKRRAGERAGITMEKIVQAARAVVTRGSGELNVKLVAEELGVAYGSIGEKLRRTDTTLERELAKHFMASLLGPHAPGDKWRERLQGLFQTALARAAAEPASVRLATPFITEAPILAPEFADRLLYILRDAGLSADDCAAAFDIVLAGLCGTLIVSCPDYHGEPSVWSEGLKKTLEDTQKDPWSSLHYARSQLALRASAKAASAGGQPSAEMTALAITMAALVINEIHRVHLKTSL